MIHVLRSSHGIARTFLALALALLINFACQAADPSSLTTIDVKQLDKIDEPVKAAIKRGDLPGAVVVVVHRGEVVFRRAYGNRATKPAELPMLADTVFDVASLT